MIERFSIAINSGVVTKSGSKPDFGVGVVKDELTQWQRMTRGELTYRFRNFKLPAAEIADSINRGWTITAQHHPPRSNANFTRAQHLGADFDHLEEEGQVLDNPLVLSYGSIIYRTSSHKVESPRLRVIFLLDEPVEDGKLYRELVLAMMYKFEGLTDPACKDYCRLFYGNVKGLVAETGAVLPLAVALEWREEYLATRPVKKEEPAGKTYEPGQFVYGHDAKRREAFGRAVLANAAAKIRSAPYGSRHDTFVAQSLNVFGFVRGGVISEALAARALLEAYPNTGGDGQAVIDWAARHADIAGLPEPELRLPLKPRAAEVRLDLQSRKYI
jgi:hypothetical protein